MASTLKEPDETDEDTCLMETSRCSLPDEPVKNLDLYEHGRNTVAEACIVVAAMAGIFAYSGWEMKDLVDGGGEANGGSS